MEKLKSLLIEDQVNLNPNQPMTDLIVNQDLNLYS